MDLHVQYAFLLTFIAGGISVWILLAMSKRAVERRINWIKQHVISLGGNVLSIELLERQHCPLASEYMNPDLVYKFYRVNYRLGEELKECWAILEMKQNWYGPSSALKEHWVWR